MRISDSTMDAATKAYLQESGAGEVSPRGLKAAIAVAVSRSVQLAELRSAIAGGWAKTYDVASRIVDELEERR